MMQGEWDWLHQGYSSPEAWIAAQNKLRNRMVGLPPGYNPNVDTGDPFQDAFSSGIVQPQQNPNQMLGAGMLGAGLGGMIGGPKYGVPGALGGAAAGALFQHMGGMDWLKGLLK